MKQKQNCRQVQDTELENQPHTDLGLREINFRSILGLTILKSFSRQRVWAKQFVTHEFCHHESNNHTRGSY